MMSKYDLYVNLLRSTSTEDRVCHLERIIEVYFYLILHLNDIKHKTQFDSEFALTLQMMFTKAKSFKKLLDGVNHTNGHATLQPIVDHTILYTIIRTAYELLYTLELIKIIPNTEDEKIIMENVYVAAGLLNRRKSFAYDRIKNYEDYLNVESQIIQDCKTRIRNTNLFSSFSLNKQNEILKSIDNGNFQLILDDTRTRFRVGWNEINKYCNIQNTELCGLYKYSCNMAHPSYLSIIQYAQAFSNDSSKELVRTATETMITIMSVFLKEYIIAFPALNEYYSIINRKTRDLMDYYCDLFGYKKC